MKLGEELYAWVVDDPSGIHGIIGFMDIESGKYLQTVSSKRETMEKARDIAVASAQYTGLPVRLLHFHSYVVVDEVKPK